MTFWITLAICVTIAVVAAFLVYFTGARRNGRHYYYQDFYDGAGVFVFYPIIGAVVGVVLGTFIGFMAATSTDADWRVYEEQELVALATQQEQEGSAGFFIFVGYGYEGETRKAYWTERDEEGVVTMDSKDAQYLRVREVETQPRVLREQKFTPAGAFLPWDVSWSYRETLEVPVGTLITEYEFQP